MPASTWLLWSVILFLQNYSFTFVSRARNSASLKRHMIAAALSNLVWFASQLIMLTALVSALRGDLGWQTTLLATVVYTISTLAGSLVAHYQALRSETGLSAVGAKRGVKQLSTDEWAELLLRVQIAEDTLSAFKSPIPLPATMPFTLPHFERSETGAKPTTKGSNKRDKAVRSVSKARKGPKN